MNKIILFALLFLIIDKNYSQVVTEWERRFNGYPGPFHISEDFAKSMAVDNLGNVYVTGLSYTSDSDFDYLTIKYDASGTEQWIRRYNGPANRFDDARSIAVDNSGNVYVTGTSYPSDFATIKYNSSGIQQWAVRYRGGVGTYNEAYVVKVDNSGYVYVTGASDSTDSPADYATIKYDSSGNQIWVVRYNGPGNFKDIPSSLVIDNFGNVFVTGQSFGNGTNYDYATIKYDEKGNRLWVARYNGSADSNDAAHSLSIDNSGNVYVTGESSNSGSGLDYTTIKYDITGNQLWTSIYNNESNRDDIAMGVTVNDSGNVFVTGYFQLSGSTYGSDYATIKYDSTGKQIWVKIFSGTDINERDQSTFIEPDHSGNIYVAGFSASILNYSYDYIVIKYNGNGDQLWTSFFNGSGNGSDIITMLIVDNYNNIYVTGYSYSNLSQDYDYLTIKYSQITGIQENTIKSNDVFKLFNNFPNPFNPKTTISYQISKPSVVNLKIYDCLGKEVKTLMNGKQNLGKYFINFDGSNISSGIYFYTLQADDFRQTRSMLLLK